MKTLITLLTILLISTQGIAQPDSLTIEDVAKSTYRFQVENGKLQGPGAEMLFNAIEGSQFFSLGEYHGESGISMLTEALFPVLAEEGYDHFAVEVGPYSAKKLTELSKSRNTLQEVHDMYASNYEETGETIIPFFDGVEDVAFLEASERNGFDLWGLDQEFLGGYLHLFDALWEASGEPNEHHYAYDKMRDRIKEFYAINQADENIEVYDQILNDAELNELFDDLSDHSCTAKDIVYEIKESCTIYHNWKADRYENLEGRNKLIKTHFADYYWSQNQRMPKVFVKMGGIHTSKGFTYNACYELGNMLHELALVNGSHDVNVTFATRYFWDEDIQSVGDNLPFDSPWIRDMTPLLAQGELEDWMLVDLRPIKKLWINRERTVGEPLKDYLKRTDYIIIMPPLPETTKLVEE